MKMDPLWRRHQKSGDNEANRLAQQCTLGLVNSRSDLCQTFFRHVGERLVVSFSLFSES
jgi:hypothetical protein